MKPRKVTPTEVKAFLAALRAWRERNGFSQRVAAKELRVHHITLAKWESGAQMPSAMAIRALQNDLKK